jgi:hypothetical protein
VAVVVFDEGASLAGNESNDSCITTSAAVRSTLRAQRALRTFGKPRPAAAQPIRPAPLTIHHKPRHDRRVVQ